MKEEINISIIGGDERALHASRFLLNMGFDVSLYGFDKNDSGDDLTSMLNLATCVLLPLNLQNDVIKTADGRSVSLDKVISAAKNGAKFFCETKTLKFLSSFLPSEQCFDINLSREFVIMNSAITAEGAIGIVMNNTKLAVCDMRVSVLGYGNLGKIVAEKLVALGADVTVFARSETARKAAAKRCSACPFDVMKDSISGFDCIINTVPAVVVCGDLLEKIDRSTCVIDLASAPGGFSSDAEKYGVSPIIAPGLPGKCAPISAGKIMAKAISDILKGEIQK